LVVSRSASRRSGLEDDVMMRKTAVFLPDELYGASPTL
jgi:succinate dehydrogenase hydrophobic anchor subunit